MKVLTEGHKYELTNFENPNQPGQVLQFIEKAQVFDLKPGQDPVPTGIFDTVNDGTTNEEVLKVLIDRMLVMYRKIPSEETFSAITHCREALYALQSRTYDRQQRGVEGKPLA